MHPLTTERIECTLYSKCKRNSARKQKSVEVSAARRDTESSPDNKADQQKERKNAEKSCLLRNHGENEIAFGKGQKTVFLSGMEESDAE